MKETIESRELYLFCENTETLYKSYYLPIVSNLIKKYNKGIYDSEKAFKSFYRIACEGSKLYDKWYGYSFTANDKKLAAKALERSFISDIKEWL